MKYFEAGDLVKDRLNRGSGAYGLGIVLGPSEGLAYTENAPVYDADQEIEGPRYEVYFTKFERTITFHADYLEKV